MEMGGSSAQISFYKPEQDILAGLFKLQLGGRRISTSTPTHFYITAEFHQGGPTGSTSRRRRAAGPTTGRTRRRRCPVSSKTTVWG